MSDYRVYRVSVLCSQSNLKILEAAKSYFEKHVNTTTKFTYAKKTNKNFGIRRNDKIGFTTTFWGANAKAFLATVKAEIRPRAVSKYGDCSMGLRQYTQLKMLPYHPDVPSFGMSICVTVSSRGWGAQFKRRAPAKAIEVDKQAIRVFLNKNYANLQTW